MQVLLAKILNNLNNLKFIGNKFRVQLNLKNKL